MNLQMYRVDIGRIFRILINKITRRQTIDFVSS